MPRVDSISVSRSLHRGDPTQAAFAFLGTEEIEGAKFELREVSEEMLKRALIRWVGAGYALSFGLSADGGALGVHLLAAGQKRTKWFSSVQELEDFLASIPEVSKAPGRLKE